MLSIRWHIHLVWSQWDSHRGTISKFLSWDWDTWYQSSKSDGAAPASHWVPCSVLWLKRYVVGQKGNLMESVCYYLEKSTEKKYVTNVMNGHSSDKWVKPVFSGWDRVGTSISKFEDKYWDIDIRNITVSHCDHTKCTWRGPCLQMNNSSGCRSQLLVNNHEEVGLLIIF